MSSKDFKTNKNKAITTIIIVVGILFLVGIIVSRAYNISQNDQAMNNDLALPEEDIILPETEGNIEHVENVELKEKQPQHQNFEDESKYSFQKIVDKPVESKQVSNNNNYTHYEEPVKKAENKQKPAQKTDYYEEPINNPSNSQKTANNPTNNESNESQIKPSKTFGTIYNVSGGGQKKSTKSNDLTKAVIHSDQVLGNGQSAIIRITQEMVLKDETILPKNSILYGEVIYGQDRVHIKINRAMISNKESIAVNMEVYDNDFIKGVYYKTEIDKGVEKTKDQTGSTITNDIPISNSTIVNKGAQLAERVIKGTVQNANETIKSNRKLKLEEGYILYIKESSRNY